MKPLALVACAAVGAVVVSSVAVAQQIPKRPETLLREPVPQFQVPYARVQERTLSNGLTLVVLEDQTVPLVDVAIAVRVGSQLEDDWACSHARRKGRRRGNQSLHRLRPAPCLCWRPCYAAGAPAASA